MTTDKPIPAPPRNLSRPRADTTTPLSAPSAPAEPPAPIPPAVAAAATGLPNAPLTLQAIHGKLCKPFAQALVELKPGAIAKDRKRALAMPFVDMRGYFTRLDRVCGPDGWESHFTFGERGVVCALTILGVTKSAIGDYPIEARDENPATSAEAQSFKRACAAFGLGRYLYALPQLWSDYDDDKKRIVDPAHVVSQMYAALPDNGDG